VSGAQALVRWTSPKRLWGGIVQTFGGRTSPNPKSLLDGRGAGCGLSLGPVWHKEPGIPTLFPPNSRPVLIGSKARCRTSEIETFSNRPKGRTRISFGMRGRRPVCSITVFVQSLGLVRLPTSVQTLGAVLYCTCPGVALQRSYLTRHTGENYARNPVHLQTSR
jgi:hypothetical protein